MRGAWYDVENRIHRHLVDDSSHFSVIMITLVYERSFDTNSSEGGAEIDLFGVFCCSWVSLKSQSTEYFDG